MPSTNTAALFWPKMSVGTTPRMTGTGRFSPKALKKDRPGVSSATSFRLVMPAAWISVESKAVMASGTSCSFSLTFRDVTTISSMPPYIAGSAACPWTPVPGARATSRPAVSTGVSVDWPLVLTAFSRRRRSGRAPSRAMPHRSMLLAPPMLGSTSFSARMLIVIVALTLWPSPSVSVSSQLSSPTTSGSGV